MATALPEADRSRIRVLTRDDTPRILEFAHSAGWNQTPADIARMLRFAPESCFGLDAENGLASTAMAFPYESEIGWIAMVLTEPGQRGRGYATALMHHSMDWLRRRGTAWMKLDASDLGRPIYERLGFRSENLMERRIRPAGSGHVEGESLAEGQIPYALDRSGFGADRRRLLDLLLEIEGIRLAVLPAGEGYAMLRPGKNAPQLGPMVCMDEASAERILRWAIQAASGGPLQWDFIRENAAALRLAEKYGFMPHRTLHRMAVPGRDRPTAFAGDNNLVFAIGGFDFG